MQVTTNWHSHPTFEEENPERWVALRKFLANSTLTDKCHVWDEEYGDIINIRLDWRGETLGIAEYTKSDILSISFTELEYDLVLINQRPRGNERKLIQRIYDEFKSTNKWPNSRELSVRTKDLGNYYKIIKQANRDYLRGGDERDVKATSGLSIRGVYICEGSDDDLSLFIQILRVFVDTYNSNPLDPRVRMLDLCESGSYTREQIDRISLLIREEGHLYTHASFTKDGESTFTVSPHILEFEKVVTIQDYLRVKDSFNRQDEFGAVIEKYPTETIELTEGGIVATPGLTETYFDYDLFISYSSRDQEKANKIDKKAKDIGLKPFLAPKNIKGGEISIEKIKEAIRKSAEVVVLVSKNSLASGWVFAEWGAAWILNKHITPLLYRCDVDEIPDLLKQPQHMDLDELDEYLQQVLERKNAS